MYRKIKDYLNLWRTSSIRTPLLVRGARQVGKSYSIRDFGHTNFESMVELNLELQPELLSCFASRQPTTILQRLESMLNIEIIASDANLLFIDEIQCSNDALICLRAFKEKMPQLPIIAAGSLLEFALEDESAISFPVGRVTFCYLHPMSFQEFLKALGEDKALRSLQQANPDKPCPLELHHKLLDMVRLYYLVGGMPEAVEAFRKNRSMRDAKSIHTRLITAFIADFAKYGRRYDHRRLQQILSVVPRLVGQQLKYSHLDPTAKARDLKKPLLDLEKAGLVRLIHATHANGLPLGSEEREGIFKLQFVDVGLMLSMLGLEAELLSSTAEDALLVKEGALAEQFVGQELLCYRDPEQMPQLYYWARDKKGAEAELDFVWASRGRIIPIEVKSGRTGRLRSLRQFMSEKESPLGVRIAQHPLSYEDGILSIPLYMCGELERLLEITLKRT